MGKIKVTDNCNGIAGLKVIEPTVFGDARGYFMETYNYNDFKEAGIDCEFVQDNQSASKKGVLRGLHFQTKNVQGKLVRVTRGAVYDVAVDLRTNSPTFGEWYGVLLTEKNKIMFYVPEGFAHGFLILEDDTEFLYKCTNLYSPEHDSGLRWNDPTINIDWKFEEFNITEEDLTISDKDKVQQLFDKSSIYFE